MQLEFVTVDVFTDRRFGGNALAVIPAAAGLTAEQMQAIAGEFNLSETTFVLPPKDPAHTAEVRIFTPKFEMPFAGHPNVGTAFVLACRTPGRHRLVFEENAGLVPLDILIDAGNIVGARLTAPQPLRRGEDDVYSDIVAEACGLAVGDIETRRHMPCVAGCGTPFVFAEVKSREALARAQPRAEIFARHFPVGGATGIHLYVQGGGDGIDIRARMFAPLHGVPEDPATGSANVALVGLLASVRSEADLSLHLRIAQGVEMGRPSLMEASAEKLGGRVVETRIGGRCVPVMRGTLEDLTMRTLDRTVSLLLLIDFQARLMPAIDGGAAAVANALRLLQTAEMLGVPLLLTEENARGLGPTVPALAAAAGGRAVHKMSFDACREAGFVERLAGRSQIVVAGCETHVCVLQTVLGLIDAGKRVYLVRDAVGSRTPESRETAIRRMAQHGVEIVTTEMVVFEWLGTAEDPRFREALRLVK